MLLSQQRTTRTEQCGEESLVGEPSAASNSTLLLLGLNVSEVIAPVPKVPPKG